MEYLSEDNILKIICEYIDNDFSRYAILIDGEWGSGKTFFIKEKLVNVVLEHEKEKVKGGYKAKIPLYISLHSIKSDTDISYQIYLQAISLLNGESKARKVANIGIKILSDIIKVKGISDENLNDALGQLVNLENYILIFDDLERCSMNINEILGYINNFVEHDGIKTVIVANQKEIGKMNSLNNLELKYLLSVQENIEFNGDKGTGINKKKSQQKTEPVKLTVKDIKSRTEYLFGENLLYNQIKEKLIGTTIYFKPDVINVINAMVDKYIVNSMLKESILSNKEYISRYINEQQHNNLRTLQFVFNIYQCLGNVIVNSDIDCKSRVLKDLLEYCLFVAIKYKKGEKTYKWEEDCEFGQVPVTDEIFCFKYISGFKFVDSFIIDSYIDEEKIVQIVKKYLYEEQKKDKDPDDPHNGLSGWWELEDEDIQDKIRRIQENIRIKKYPISFYPKIILTLINITEAGFCESLLTDTLLLMKEVIAQIDTVDIRDFDISSVIISNAHILDKYNSCVLPLKELFKNSKEKIKYNQINELFNDINDWGIRFEENCRAESDRYLNDRMFFGLLDIKKVISCIKKANSENLCHFRYGIGYVYNFSNINEYYKNDLPNLKSFFEELSKLSDTGYDITKKLNIQLLSKLIDEKTKLIEKDLK